MTPTLLGRLETRIFALATAGALWTLIISPVLPDRGDLGDAYQTTFGVLLAVGVVGLGWEPIYHLAQQLRWEKDWPTMFGFLTGFNEGILLWLLIDANAVPWIEEAMRPSLAAFAVHFTTTWIVVWLFLNGPMRVLLVRWRFRGGEIL